MTKDVAVVIKSSSWSRAWSDAIKRTKVNRPKYNVTTGVGVVFVRSTWPLAGRLLRSSQELGTKYALNSIQYYHLQVAMVFAPW